MSLNSRFQAEPDANQSHNLEESVNHTMQDLSVALSSYRGQTLRLLYLFLHQRIFL